MYEKILNQQVYTYYINKKIQELKKWFNAGNVILDLGCGTGAYTTKLASQCKTIIGLDISKEMIKVAASKAKRKEINNIQFIIGDSTHIPFCNHSFDLIYSVNLIHHVVNKKKIESVILEKIRCLKNNGFFLILDLNKNSLGWSDHTIPKIIRGFVHGLLYPIQQTVLDHVEENTKIIDITKILKNMSEIKVILIIIGGFIPTYCPRRLFNTFIFFEKILEKIPILHRYGAHILVVGKVNDRDNLQ